MEKGWSRSEWPYPGRGKSGSARLLVAQRIEGLIIFLVGRDKSDPGTDFTLDQENVAKALVGAYEKLNAAQLQRAMDAGALKEICDDNQDATKP